jgi:hypothetical protein
MVYTPAGRHDYPSQTRHFLRQASKLTLSDVAIFSPHDRYSMASSASLRYPRTLLVGIIGDLALSSSWVDTCEVLNRFKSNVVSAGAEHQPAHCNHQEIYKLFSEISVLITTLWQAKQNCPSEFQTTPSPVYLQEQPTFEFESLQNEELDKCCRKLIQSLIDYASAWIAVRWPTPAPGDTPHQSEDTDYDQNSARLKLMLQSTHNVVLSHLNELHSISDIPGHDIHGHKTNSCAEELQSESATGSTHHGELDIGRSRASPVITVGRQQPLQVTATAIPMPPPSTRLGSLAPLTDKPPMISKKRGTRKKIILMPEADRIFENQVFCRLTHLSL